MRHFGYVCVVFLFLMFGFFVTAMVQKSDEDAVRDWAASNNCRVVKIEQCFFDYGPFWYKDEDDRIWRAEISDAHEQGKVVYFRIGLFRFDHEYR